MQDIYSRYSTIEKKFKKGEIDFAEYSNTIIQWNSDFSDITKAMMTPQNQDASHGGKLVKKVITDKTGKKVTKWVSANQGVKTKDPKQVNGSVEGEEDISHTEIENQYPIEQWEKQAKTASDKALQKASIYAGSAEIRRIAKHEILKRELVPQSFIDLSLMPDFMLDSFVDRYKDVELSAKENEALAIYRDNGYISINRKIRNKEKFDENEAKTVKTIEKAIDKSELTNDITLWRGLTGKSSLLYINHLKSLKPGDTFEEPSFTSTSLVQGQAIKFKDLYKDTSNLVIKILAPKGSKALSMQNAGGEDEKIMYKDEYEFLLQRNAKFQIIESKDNEITVKLI